MNIIRRAIFEKVSLKKGLRVGIPYVDAVSMEYILVTTIGRPPIEIATISPKWVCTYQTSTLVQMHTWGAGHE